MKQKMWQEWTQSLSSTKGKLFKWPSILLVEDGHSGHSGWMAFFRFSMTLRLFSVSPLLPCYEHNSQIRHGMLESQIWARQTFGRERHGNNLNVLECPEGMNRTTPAFKHFSTAWCQQKFPACYRNACKSFIIHLWKPVFFCCHLFRVQIVGGFIIEPKKN